MNESEDSRFGSDPPTLVEPLVTQRPTWMVVLVALMFLFGARLFFTSLTTFRGLQGDGKSVTVAVSTVDTQDQVLARDLQALSRSFDQANPNLVRLHAVSKLVLALAFLFAVAAILSSDRRARRATMTCAWLAIAYHVGNTLFLIVIVREGVMAAAPLMADLATYQGAKVTSVPELISYAGTFMIVYPVLTAIAGVAFSAALLIYFGGRRGRLFYGLERPVDHGG